LLIPHLRQVYCLAVRGIVRQVRSMLSSLVWHHFINISSLMPIYLLPMFVAVRLSPVDNAYYYTTSMVSNLFLMMSSAVATSLFAEGSHEPDDVLRKARFSAVIIGLLLAPTMLAVI